MDSRKTVQPESGRSAIVIHGRIERGNRTVIEQAAVFLTFVGLLVAVFVTTHVFYRLTDTYPVYVVDDSLANLSVTLSNLGIYGLPAVPMQGYGGSYVLRIGGFYNYGPFPFYAGAALDWLFGTGYDLQRFLHPICLFLSAIVGFFAFRRLNVGLAAIYAWLILAMFWSVMWPMVRPDPFTALFAIVTIACFTAALVTEKRRFWFAGSFFAMTAVTTHLVVAAIVPWTLIVITAGLYFHWSVNRTDLYVGRYIKQRLILCLVGALLGLAIFLEAIDFRLIEFYSLAVGVSHRDGGFDFAKFASVFVAQLKWTWEYVPTGIKGALFLGIASGVFSLAILPIFERRHVVAVIAYFALPLTFLIFYSLSMGLYPNYHTGYSLVGQLAGAWTAAAGYGTLFWLIAERRPVVGPIATFATPAAGLVLLVAQAVLTLNNGPSWAKENYVPFTKYYNQVMENLPDRALILAGAIFGLESGTRFALMQWSDATIRMEPMSEQERQEVAPDYLILNDFLRYMIVGYLTRNPGLVFPILSGFGDVTYQQKKIVDAEPYGPTIVYERRKAETGTFARPLVASYNQAKDVWNSNLAEISPPDFELTQPVSFDLQAFKVNAVARISKKFRLRPGTYLFQVTPAEHGSGVYLATTTARFQSARGTNLNFELDVTPFAPSDNAVYLLVRHPGGDLYISDASLNDARNPVFSVTRAWRVLDYNVESIPIAVAPVSEWENANKSTLQMQSDGWLLVDGDDTRYWHEVRSPAVEVPPNTELRFRIDVDELQGHVSVGILNEAAQNWVYAPLALNQYDFTFNSGNNSKVYIVIANLQRGTPVKTRFKIAHPRMTKEQSSIERIYSFLGCAPAPATPKEKKTLAMKRAAEYCRSVAKP